MATPTSSDRPQNGPENAPESETRGAPRHHGGRTTTIRNEQGAHPLPHERDESTGEPAPGEQPAHTPDGGASDIGRRAHQDVERGLADTSRGETADETCARGFRSHPATPPHRRAPSGTRR